MARPHGRPVVIDTDPGAGLSPRLIPLDVTRQVAMHRAAIRRLTTNTSDPVCLFFGDATGPALDFAERVEGEPVFPFHDPLAVAAAADPSFIEWAPLQIAIQTKESVRLGATVAGRRGRTNADTLQGRAQVAMQVHAARAVSLFQARLCRTCS